MANYSTLKAAVQDVVKTNGEQEITGANLQTVLLSIINSIGGGGYIFKGIASPSTSAGTPDQNVFYIGGEGTYGNFGTSVTVPSGSICVFKYNGSWVKEQVTMFNGIDDTPTIGSQSLVKSGGVYLDDLTIERSIIKQPIGKNLFNVGGDLKTGYYIDSTGQYVGTSAFNCSEIIPVLEDTDYCLSCILNGSIAAVGNSNSYGFFFFNDGTKQLFSTNVKEIHTPAGCEALQFSYAVNGRKYIQLEQGTERTEYEQYGGKDYNDIIVDSVQGVNDEYLQLTSNLANQSNMSKGVYVHSSGSLLANSNYNTYIIKAQGGKQYQFFASDKRVLLTTFVCEKNKNGDVLTYNTNIDSIVTNEDTAWLYVSFLKANVYAQITEGTERTPYTDGKGYLQNKYNPVPEIVFPSTLYVLLGEQNSFYHKAYMNFYNPYKHFLEKGTNSDFNYNKRCFRIENTANSVSRLQFNLVDAETMEQLNAYNFVVRGGSKTNTANLAKINVIGDSFCYGGHYLKQLDDMCDNVQFVGMRKSESYTINCEGRGGWTLGDYFNPKSKRITLTGMESFSPFMHAAGYNYYGVMEFWASIVNGTSQHNYGTAGFGDYASWFDTNGRKKNPSAGDMVYNQTAGKYEVYNGSAWAQLSEEPTFTFDYAKYAQIWNISTPDFVVIQLGTNDFYTGNYDFAAWAENLNTLIDSINAYGTQQSKIINILLCTVLTISGLPNNNYGDGDVIRNRYYWEARKLEIFNYDTTEMKNNKHVSVVDTGTVVDDEFGFQIEEKLPFSYYEGDAREPYDWNGVHPSFAGYKQFGNAIAGAIQYMRV